MGKVEILIDDLRKRKTPSLSGIVLGFIPKGIYDYTDSKVIDDYVWLKINDFWVATKEGSWTKIQDKEKREEEALKIIKEQLKVLVELNSKEDLIISLGVDE